MVITLSLPKDLESQLTELSDQKGESPQSLMLTAISYYILVSKHIIDDLNQQDDMMKQREIDKIHQLRGKFKGCLSSSEEFARRKKREKEMEL
jgi:hypothetical protein